MDNLKQSGVTVLDFEQDSLREKLYQVAKNQNQLNKKVREDWQNAQFPFYRALWREAAEALDYTNWEWWKAHPADSNVMQLHLELADMLHFGVSMRLMEAYSAIGSEKDESALYLAVANGLVDDIAALAGSTPPASAVDGLEAIAARALDGKFSAIQLFATAQLTGLDTNGLLAFYFGKNVLNRFRQDNGYKTGGYLKNWRVDENDPPKVEDNFVLARALHDIIGSVPASDLNNILGTENFSSMVYGRLESAYKNVRAFADHTRSEHIR